LVLHHDQVNGDEEEKHTGMTHIASSSSRDAYGRVIRSVVFVSEKREYFDEFECILTLK
jgi:hypothetical protein